MATSRFLSNSDQSLNTTDSPTFTGLTVNGAGPINLNLAQATEANPDGNGIGIHSGAAHAASGNGGTIEISAGDADAGNGGDIRLSSGTGFGFVGGGEISLTVGESRGTNKAGRNLNLTTGASTGTAAGGAIKFNLVTNLGASGTDQNWQEEVGSMQSNVFTWNGALSLTPRAVASLPASPVEGMLAWVNDSSTATWGATIAGGGANKVLAVFNGTNWTCAGK